MAFNSPVGKCFLARVSSGSCHQVGVKSTEFTLHHNFGKVGFLGQGSDDNIWTCDYDSRLCIPSLVDRLRVKNPNWLVEPRQDDYLFLLDDGNLIEKTVITRLLRTAALRSGLDPSVMAMDTHSLRGPASAQLWRTLGSLSTRSNAEAAGLRRAGRFTVGARGRLAVTLLTEWFRRPVICLLAHLRSKMPSEPPVV